MRWMIPIAIAALLASPAMAATTICRPTYAGFLEFVCEVKEAPVNVAPFCDVMNRQGGPVRWSRNDTEDTKNRADLINAAGKRACGWGKK
ncbi:hypothetical protein FNL55_12765 [Tardiphaga sp. vice352]|uniref:hypothetical protein n=1 Tax=Tardiphaga sp. vice352 TaxID=2592816 RepID=UPI001164D243|nr:hypothetical protein [Tardiphaga sp. vice352]QDM32111.1 hypothetical protein FNL55_12765 [Tardiphaga sp. vice352]